MSVYDRYKGNDRVIEAIPQLVAQGHDVVYVVIGEGDDRHRLQALADRLGVANRVKFAGAAGLDVLVDAYRMADVFVMASTGEGFGIAFLEAMACGTPALGLNVAGARDSLADGELATLISASDLTATLSAMLRRTKPDPGALAAAVRCRFGAEAFATGAESALAGIWAIA
jgi:phosphatidylinositol alpha-1,6-mannosyltransferase